MLDTEELHLPLFKVNASQHLHEPFNPLYIGKTLGTVNFIVVSDSQVIIG